MWPVADMTIAAELAKAGLLPDAYVKHRRSGTFEPARPAVDRLAIRLAARDDLTASVTINAMVLEEHVMVSPFARQVPGVDERFTGRFLAAVTGVSPAIFMVATLDDQVVAMAECEMETHGPGPDPTFRPGTMGYVHVFGVDRNVRRRGIGTALASRVLSELTARGADGVRLLVSHYNPASRLFWQTIGFSEVWQLYQTHEIN
jgi:ribosomal protein S18 acetylase RimI-like enzyme